MILFVSILNALVLTSKLSRRSDSLSNSYDTDFVIGNSQNDEDENDIDEQQERIRNSLDFFLSKYARSAHNGEKEDRNRITGFDRLSSNIFSSVKLSENENRFRLK